MDTAFNPYAPITPAQLTAVHALTTRLGRHDRERLNRAALGLSCGEAEGLLAHLRGEPRPPKPQLDLEPQVPGVRASNAVLRAQLDAGYAGRAMQGRGAHEPSLFAGLNGNPLSMTR